MMLGNVNLDDYINIVEQNERKALEDTLEKLRKDNLLSEKFFRDELQKRLDNCSVYPEYPIIDVSFLQKTNKIMNPYSEKEIIVPAFGIYDYFGGNSMNVDYKFLKPENSSKILKIRSDGPYELRRQFLEGIKKNSGMDKLEIYRSDWDGINGKIENPSRKLRKTYKGKTKNEFLRISSYFNGLIPDATKEKVKRATETFGEDNIYIVAEIESENWNVKSYLISDPLIIGLKYGREKFWESYREQKFYFIDHFNCTPLENLVKDNYVGEKLN